MRVAYLFKLGDWWCRDETHRVFGCEIGRPIEWFNSDEILEVAWLPYREVSQLAAGGRLHAGFELAAISEFRRRRSD